MIIFMNLERGEIILTGVHVKRREKEEDEVKDEERNNMEKRDLEGIR